MVRVFAHGVMGRQIGPSWGGPIDLFLCLWDGAYKRNLDANQKE